MSSTYDVTFVFNVRKQKFCNNSRYILYIHVVNKSFGVVVVFVIHVFEQLRAAARPVALTQHHAWIDYYCIESFGYAAPYFQFCQVFAFTVMRV